MFCYHKLPYQRNWSQWCSGGCQLLVFCHLLVSTPLQRSVKLINHYTLIHWTRVCQEYFQVECGLKCMVTAGCLTLRYKDGVCALGGFHAFNDGPESEMCFLNHILFYGGLVSNVYFHYFINSNGPKFRIRGYAIWRCYHPSACLGARIWGQLWILSQLE